MLKARLLYPNQEMNSQSAYAFQNDIVKDFNMAIIFKTMARENENISMAVRKVMLTPLHTEEEVLYRQGVLQDVINHSDCFDEIYHYVELMCHMMDTMSGGKSDSKTSQMIQNLHLLQGFVGIMLEMQRLLAENSHRMESEGVRSLIERIQEIDWEDMQRRCQDMNFASPGGTVTLNLSLGKGLKMDHIEIQSCKGGDKNKESSAVKGIKKVFNKVTGQNVVYLETEVLEKSSDEMKNAIMHHMLSHYNGLIEELKSFFKSMLTELGFYLGCNQLYKRFEELGIPFCIPTVVTPDRENEKKLYFKDLYELTLAIYTRKMPVPNDMAQINKKLYVITGANQGGKSTFLRSIGIAQVMMQCGMYVPARAYSNCLYDTILTHFTRREDQQLNSGRLDEELHRMSQMIDCVTDKTMMLLNESFASTTEKEGSVIAEDIVTALYELGADVFMVTHLFEFARKQYEKGLEEAVYLTAERKEDGERTFKMILHKPDYTSYGLDLYDKIIGKPEELQ